MSFWTAHIHPIIFILFLMVFPRLTLLVWWLAGILSITFFGFIFWLISPSFLIAYLASSIYWETNPTLVILSWIWAVLVEIVGSKTWRENETGPRSF